MITKERLEELIEKKATIWGITEDYELLEIYTPYLHHPRNYKTNKVCENKLNVAYENYHKSVCVFEVEEDYSNIFETKEDAEEYAEFGNITKTERLPYFPKYEDIEYEGGYFIRKFHIKDNYDGFGKLMVIKDFVILVQCSSLGVLHEQYFDKPATRENYNEARRLCVKLFKGENNG